MFAFHYLICTIPKKDKYHVMKLVFMDNKLENNTDMLINKNKLDNLKSSLDKEQFTEINDTTVNIESFLKHINLFNT